MIPPVSAALATELRTVLRAHERALGCTVCLRALEPRWRRRLHPVLPENMRLHYSPFCMGHKRASEPRCKQDCNTTCAGECLRQREGPFLRRCHAGANELIVPLFEGGSLVAMLHVGQFRLEPHQPAVLPRWSRPQLAAATALLRSLAAWLRDLFDRLRLAETSAPGGERARIEAFLDAELANDPKLGDLARELKASPAWTATLVKRHLGCSFRAAKQQRRLALARHLLEVSDAPIAAVASRAGFADPDYFCRHFKAKTGLTPSEHRRTHARSPSV